MIASPIKQSHGPERQMSVPLRRRDGDDLQVPVFKPCRPFFTRAFFIYILKFGKVWRGCVITKKGRRKKNQRTQK